MKQGPVKTPSKELLYETGSSFLIECTSTEHRKMGSIKTNIIYTR